MPEGDEAKRTVGTVNEQQSSQWRDYTKESPNRKMSEKAAAMTIVYGRS